MSIYDSIFINMVLKSDDSEWLHHNIAPKMLDSSVRPIYSFVINHYSRYSKLPSRKEVKRNFPNFKFYAGKEPMPYYVEQIRKAYRLAKIRNILTDCSDAFSRDNLEETLELYRNGYTDLYGSDVSNIGAANYAEVVKTAYKEVFEEKCLSADYPFGEPLLDTDFLGQEKGDWTLLAGTAAAGKTWTLLKMLHNLWKHHQLNVLLISCELSNKIVIRRLHAITAEVNYKKFRRGELTPAQRMRIRIESLRKNPARFDIISAANHDPSEGRLGSLDSIRMKIQQYKPDILGVDGLYLGMDMDKWAEAVRFANDFHFMLQETHTPALTTSQLKNVGDPAKPQMKDLAFTSAFQQATDFVFLLSKDEQMRLQKSAMFHIGKAREDEDCKSYLLKYNPGAEVYLTRLDKQATNPLMSSGGSGKNPGKKDRRAAHN